MRQLAKDCGMSHFAQEHYSENLRSRKFGFREYIL